ncbi:MAG TPA: PqiC family protein, partial [Nevskiaceae bacterium]|nr:PqiC family protein [Nevskiaceae bacterium]
LDVAAVSIPAQVDMPQLVVREGGGQVAVAEQQQWIAPLADEIRNALSADLTQRLHAVDVHRAARSADDPVWRVQLDVQRFDSLLGQRAHMEAVWSLRAPGKDAAALSCPASADVPVSAGYAALVEGHQQALRQIAAQIAGAIEAGSAARCP